MRTTCPVIGLPPVGPSTQSSHDDCEPANAVGVTPTPGTDGAASVPEPGGNVVEPGTVVAGPVLVGTAVGLPNANLLGEPVPMLVTTLLVEELIKAVMTVAGDDEGAADR